MAATETNEKLQKLLAQVNAALEKRKGQPMHQMDAVMAKLSQVITELRNNKPVVNIPSTMRVMEPSWLDRLRLPDFEGVKTIVRNIYDTITDFKINWPQHAKEAIPVRLVSKDEEFYDANFQVFQQSSGGGSGGNVVNIPKVTITGGQQAIPVVNPDGTTLAYKGEYNSTPPTLANGDTDNLQLDSSGNLLVNLAKLISGEDQTWQYMKVMQGPATYSNISADALVKSGGGRFFGFICNSTSSGTVKIYDSTAASGTVIMNTFTPAASGMYTFPFGVSFSTGLYFDITNTLDVTVFYI